jgi:hypothetical protein
MKQSKTFLDCFAPLAKASFAQGSSSRAGAMTDARFGS